MTYNIWDGGKERLPFIVEVIKQQSPDFLAIQEANMFTENNLEKISNDMGFPYCALGRSEKTNYHTASFSKHPFSKVMKVKGLRNSAFMTTIGSDYGDICIANTHLSWTTEDERFEEIEKVMESQKDYKNTIIIGDLNSLSPQDNYSNNIVLSFSGHRIEKFTKNGKLSFDIIQKIISSGFIDVAVYLKENQINTVPTASNVDDDHKTPLRLDYIFVSESLVPFLKSLEVIKTELSNKASDHYPVVAVLDLN